MKRFTHQDLRRHTTFHEKVMWHHLQAKKFYGLKFRRQHPIGPFIVDFVNLKWGIVVELDGEIHNRQRDYDQRRDRWLSSQGYEVIRIRNAELDESAEQVLLKLKSFVIRHIRQKSIIPLKPHPQSLP